MSQTLSNSLHGVIQGKDRRWENTLSEEETALFQGTSSTTPSNHATKKGADPPSARDVP